MSWQRWQGETLLLDLRVQPRAKRELVDGLYGERLRVRITAPPVDNKANGAIVALLAHEFGVPQQRVTLVQGEKGQNKTVAVERPASLPGWYAALGGLPRDA
jgi:hypothetical protein